MIGPSVEVGEEESDGFTMLEVLIGIALTSMLLLLLSEMAFFANLSFSEVRDAAKHQNNAIVFRSSFIQSLESAYPYRGAAGVADKSGIFRGDELTVQYSAYSDTRPHASFEMRVGVEKLTLLEEGEILTVLSTRGFWLSDASFEQGCLRYFGVQEGDSKPTWSNGWLTGGRMPTLLAITNQCDELRLEPATNFRWEFFALPVTASGSCEFDELLQRCRGGV